MATKKGGRRETVSWEAVAEALDKPCDSFEMMARHPDRVCRHCGLSAAEHKETS